jgi:hypothetical protein
VRVKAAGNVAVLRFGMARREIEIETPPGRSLKGDELQPKKVSVHVQDRGEIAEG